MPTFRKEVKMEILVGITARTGKHQIIKALRDLTVDAEKFHLEEWCRNDIENLIVVVEFLREKLEDGCGSTTPS